MHITITGDLGSGKSTICQLLNQKLGFQIYSTGKVQRELAREYNMSTLEFNRYTSVNTNIDREIDDKVVSISKEKINDDLIFDSRMAWNFIPHSLKIYLTAKPEIAAQRIYQNDRGSVEAYHSIEDALHQLLERRQLEISRFQNIYGVDCNDFKHFDLIIDTSFASIQEVFEIICNAIEQFSNRQPFAKHWVSAKNVYPTKTVEKAHSETCTEVVSGVYHEGYYHLLNGHGIVSACLKKNITLFPMLLVSDFPLGMNSVPYSCYEDWESFHCFKFDTYPKKTA